MDADKLSRYRILSDVGRGGMGRVCLAEDTQLHRKVALKLLAPEAAGDASANRRLLREAQAAASLDHPFICKVYEVGQHGDEPFIAMEYLEGQTLHERLKRGPLPLADALRFGAEIAEALDCAQSNGVVHRDLKPANVMLTRDGHAKVMDFGIAQHTPGAGTGAADTATATRTATNLIAGTPKYMSPEQLRGETVDSRSDIFSFGLLLHEMVTGRHPFASESPLVTAESILHAARPPLADVKGAPALLDHVMERLLAREKDRRFQTFRDVRAELMSVTGMAASRRAATSSGWRRRRVIPIAAALTMAVAVAAWWLSGRLSQPALAFNERDWIVIADVDNQTGDPVFDRSLSAALTVGLTQSRYVNVLPASRVRGALQRMQRQPGARLDEAQASEVAIREGAKAVVAASIAALGNVYQITAQLVDPQTRAPVVSESVRANGKDGVLPALDELVTRLRRNLGESLAAVSNQHLALPRATTASLDALKLYADAGRAPDTPTAIRLLEQAVELDPGFAMAHAQLGLDYYLQSTRAERIKGEMHVTKALSLLDRLSNRERLLITALAEDSRGQREAAVTAYKAYLTAYPDDGNVWFRLGWTYMATLRQFEPAVDAFKRVIAINSRDAAALVDLATSYSGLRRYQDARGAYEKAFAIQPSLKLGPFINHEYGFTLIRLGDVQDAVAAFEKMIASPQAELRAKGYRSTAVLDMYQGRYRAAQSALNEAIAINHANNFPVSEFRDHLFLAAVLAGRGDRRALDDEMDSLDAQVARLSLGPEWLHYVVKLFARNGRLPRAQALLGAMQKRINDPTSDSAVNRSWERDRANVEIARGEVAMATGRPDEAITDLKSAVQVVTEDGDAMESLAAAYRAAGRIKDAADAYQEVIAIQPFDSEGQPYWFEAHLRLAEIDGKQGDAAGARALYREMLEVWKDGDSDLLPLREARQALGRIK
jgi:serine/threonine protein kinase/tetratricopeptide (TPR) repeat protein